MLNKDIIPNEKYSFKDFFDMLDNDGFMLFSDGQPYNRNSYLKVEEDGTHIWWDTPKPFPQKYWQNCIRHINNKYDTSINIIEELPN